MERRIAAILAADVAGYSRLMAADEESTFSSLRSHRRDHVDPTITAHQGRIANTAGDSLLVEFPNAVQAVRCAVAMQLGMAERNTNIVETDRIRFRVGINVGTVIVEDGDMFGDQVNVAARLEGIAPPGGIYISGTAGEQVRGEPDLALEDLGDVKVKNIPKPVRVFEIRMPGIDTADAAPAERDQPSIAVLPFENRSGDAEQEYFSDGITEDIITDLSKVAGLFVIARNSSFSYKGKAPVLTDVCRELGVRHVLEGSVRKAGDRIRVTAQLSDGASGGQVWAERFDRQLEDIFAVQDELVLEIVGALASHLKEDQGIAPSRTAPASAEAYDYLLKGREQIVLHTQDANRNAIAYFSKVNELDPGFAPALAHLAESYLQQVQIGICGDPEAALSKARDFAVRALALDDLSAHSHGVMGQVHQWCKEHEPALAEAKRRVQLDPGGAEGMATYGIAMHFDGQHEAAISTVKRAIRLDPHYPFWYLFAIGVSEYMLGRYDDAVHTIQRCIFRNPSSSPLYLHLAASYAQLDQGEEAADSLAKAFELKPDLTRKEIAEFVPYRQRVDLDHYLDGLRKAGLPE